MLLQDIVKHIKNNNLPNVSNFTQMKDEQIIEQINEALTSLYSTFIIKKEQAIIRVQDNRHTFTLVDDDPDVIISSLYKMNYNELKKRIEKSPYVSNSQFQELKDLEI